MESRFSDKASWNVQRTQTRIKHKQTPKHIKIQLLKTGVKEIENSQRGDVNEIKKKDKFEECSSILCQPEDKRVTSFRYWKKIEFYTQQKYSSNMKDKTNNFVS